MTDPIVTVCIPAYNHEKYVGPAIESVLAQTMGNFEIVITDDGSTDRTAEVIASYTDDRVRAFSMTRNMGPGAAANNNLRHARGRYIALLASDDVYVPDKLERQVCFLDNNAGVGAVFSWMTYVDELGSALSVPISTGDVDAINRSQAEWLRELFLVGNPFSAPTALIRRDLLERVGNFDPRLLQLQDFDLWIRICLVTQVHVLPERLLCYRVRDNLENVSANTTAQQARTYWEYEKVLHHFRRTPKDLFCAAFGSLVPENARKLPRDAQLALVALSLSAPFTRSFGLNLAYEVLGDVDLREPLATAGFDYPWLFRSAADVDPFGLGGKDWCKRQIENWKAAHASTFGAYQDLLNAYQRLEAQHVDPFGLGGHDWCKRQIENWKAAHASTFGAYQDLLNAYQRLEAQHNAMLAQNGGFEALS